MQQFIDTVTAHFDQWMAAQSQVLECFRSKDENNEHSYDIIKNLHPAPKGISDREFLAVRSVFLLDDVTLTSRSVTDDFHRLRVFSQKILNKILNV